jgi:hypothetical protein
MAMLTEHLLRLEEWPSPSISTTTKRRAACRSSKGGPFGTVTTLSST